MYATRFHDGFMLMSWLRSAREAVLDGAPIPNTTEIELAEACGCRSEAVFLGAGACDTTWCGPLSPSSVVFQAAIAAMATIYGHV